MPKLTLPELDARLTPLFKTVSVAIFFGNEYRFADSSWGVQIMVVHEGAKLEVRASGKSLEEVLGNAWEKVEHTIVRGMGATVLLPPIDVKE